jgi:hypothetical protein
MNCLCFVLEIKYNPLVWLKLLSEPPTGGGCTLLTRAGQQPQKTSCGGGIQSGLAGGGEVERKLKEGKEGVWRNEHQIQ